MGRVVDLTAPLADLINPWVTFHEGNAWLVHLVAGDFREAMKCVPYPLPHIAFERRGILRAYPLSDFALAAG